ncbi:serine O-acetyltransferase [Rufibacter quisquiliarum]|uniref:Serine O-acetyltransferase n=1 Tax=Rufibacter quisquiliarum TaxID=1549639 RepID=A0A839GUX7_9BACT|nr:serine acetyltransferase [Rufibacter quisquiliarum]MBA9078228.1 serine O-acetyltransferase [Rufibacter quisquiliarum]
MEESFLLRLWGLHQQNQLRIPTSLLCQFLNRLLQVLFPPLAEQPFKSMQALGQEAAFLEQELETLLEGVQHISAFSAAESAERFMQQLPHLHEQLLADAHFILQEDPAARHVEEVMRSYPGFYGIAVYRIAHILYQDGVPLLPRILTEYAHGRTGIDIHPGARIGYPFCIDHGTGIVIGETTVIGSHVKLYQGVTLGALSVAKYMMDIKRHPTLEDNVIIYAGATILGGNTVIGAHSIIGGNVWLTESVPAYSRLYHRAQIKVSRSEAPEDMVDFSI